MRATTRAFAVLTLGGALVLGGASAALAAPCPVGTYPPGQNCTISGGTTDGQVSGSTGGSSSGSTSGSTGSTGSTGAAPAPSATPEVVTPTSEPVSSPTPEAPSTTGGTTGEGNQAGGPTVDDSALSPMSYAVGSAVLLLLFGLLLFLAVRRRKTPATPSH